MLNVFVHYPTHTNIYIFSYANVSALHLHLCQPYFVIKINRYCCVFVLSILAPARLTK